jgi:hypothetical protein
MSLAVMGQRRFRESPTFLSTALRYLGRGGHGLRGMPIPSVVLEAPLIFSCPRTSTRFLNCRIMANSNIPPRRLADIIDYIEKVREELLTIQRSLEKLESAQSAASGQRDISK